LRIAEAGHDGEEAIDRGNGWLLHLRMIIYIM